MKHTLIKSTIITALILAMVTPAHATRAQFPVMCFDPLLTSVLILDVNQCRGGDVTVKQDNDSPTLTITATDQPTIVITATPNPTNTPDPVTPATNTPKVKCNKGEGNGGEGCDPGNNPDKGNDDEN
jgi:hypothetical protein